MTNIIKETNRTEQVWELFKESKFKYSYDNYINEFISNNYEIDSDLIDSGSWGSFDFSTNENSIYVELMELENTDSENPVSYSVSEYGLIVNGSELPETDNIESFLEFMSEKILDHYSNSISDFISQLNESDY